MPPTRVRSVAGVGRPGEPPTIDYHSLESAVDRAHLASAAEIGMAILDSAGDARLGARHTSPRRRADLDAWIDDNITTAVHLCSSAPMGPDSDPTAVVDQYCRVRGVEGLRVVDTSVLPTAPSRGPGGHRRADRRARLGLLRRRRVMSAFSLADHLIAAVAAAGAGAVNAIAGGGTLISFPTLVALGASKVGANVTNTVALVPGLLRRRCRPTIAAAGAAAAAHSTVDRRRARRAHRIGAAAGHGRGRVHQVGPVADPVGLRVVGRAELHPQMARASAPARTARRARSRCVDVLRVDLRRLLRCRSRHRPARRAGTGDRRDPAAAERAEAGARTGDQPRRGVLLRHVR